MADLVNFASGRTASNGAAEQGRASAASPSSPWFSWSAPAGFDLRQFLNVLSRRRAVILGWTGLMTIIAGIVAFQLTPIYRAEAIVMLNTRKTEVLNVKAVVSGLPSDEAAVRSEVEVLNSPALASRVVNKLDLTTNPLINTSLQPPSVWERYNPIALLEHYFSPKATQPYETSEEKERRLHDAAVQYLRNNVTIFNDGRSYIIKIRYESPDPILAAKIANAYADQYLLTSLQSKLDETERATNWLNTHLTVLRNKARDSDQAVQLYRAQHNLIGTKDFTVTTQQLSELNSQLIIATADETQKAATLRQVEALVHSGNEDSVAQVLASPTIQQLKLQESTLLQKQAQLSTRYRPEYPEMINLQAQINDVRSKIHHEINNVLRSMVNEVAAARARVRALTANIKRLQQKAAVQDEASVQLRELQREADANRTLYNTFLNRFKETSAQEDIQQADARMVSPASVPEQPSFPNKRALILMAFAISLITGVMIAFLIEHLDNGFRNGDQVEKLGGTRFLGNVPAVASGKAPHQIVVTQPISAYSEAIRSVRTALNFSNVDNPPKVVLVTSSLPNEGKTTLAASLAQSVARSGQRALLVDCDLRHPSVGRLFQQPKDGGLINLFKESAELPQMIQIDPTSHLHYIPVQGGTSNPQDLLGSQHMKTFVRHLRDQYDLVVLDAPPVLAVTDCLVLSHIADAAVFAIQWEQTPRQIALGALKLMQTQGANLAGVVLTRVNVRKHARYAFGDTGYYYGRYGTYYGKGKEA